MIQDVYNVINCYFIDNGLSNEMFIRLCGSIDKKKKSTEKEILLYIWKGLEKYILREIVGYFF